MRILRDEPYIRSALLTGYPDRRTNPVCENCGGDFDWVAYRVESQWVCTECFRDWVDHCFLSNRDELADKLGVDVRYIA